MGSITGVIHLDFGGVCFPEQGWDDFAVVICGWWLEALIALYREESAVAECHFMDGPYVFEVSPGERARWNIVCAQDDTLFGDGKLSVVHRHQVEAAECLGSLIQISRDLLAACESQGWNNADIQLLRSLAEAAEGVLGGG